MKLKLTTLVKLMIPASILAYLYYPTFVWMVDRWSVRDSYYSHGFLIPLVTIYWLYKKRDTLSRCQSEMNLGGIIFLTLGGLMQIISAVLRIYFLSAFSFVFVLLGAGAILFGKRGLKEIWFPVVFLFTMIPLPILAISEMAFYFKIIVTKVSTQLINMTGIAAVQEGSYIRTPNSIMEVGDPCSGLRSFLSFLCLGLIFAYESKLPLWKRTVLALSGFPLAIFSNILRVFFLGLVGEIYGTEYAKGKIHDISGFVVFIIAFFIFMLIRQQLESRAHEN